MKQINYIELGGTLFIPAIHKNLRSILLEEKYKSLKSLVVDTEDGVSKESLRASIEAIRVALSEYKKGAFLLFIRPRNVGVLKEILELEGIEKIDGFVLPKFSLLNANEYFKLLKPYSFSLMPSIEGEELFNHEKLHKLKEIILENRERVVLIRFGLEDMLKTLGMKRHRDENIFDVSAVCSVLGNFIATFKSVGFAISGGVYGYFEDEKGFIEDVKRELKEGLFSKTIIHPNQIEPINELYKVSQKEFDEALEICLSSEAVFNQASKMAEVVTMLPYAKEVVLRAEVYGIKK